MSPVDKVLLLIRYCNLSVVVLSWIMSQQYLSKSLRTLGSTVRHGAFACTESIAPPSFLHCSEAMPVKITHATNLHNAQRCRHRKIPEQTTCSAHLADGHFHAAALAGKQPLTPAHLLSRCQSSQPAQKLIPGMCKHGTASTERRQLLQQRCLHQKQPPRRSASWSSC
jgi:hypothetical protein